jgi:hypothetical protein
MKSIEVIVPRRLIKKFYKHPEPYGDGAYVVDLINGMYTDVFYREEGGFITITSEKELIAYLKKNQSISKDYFFRDGVYSFRQIKTSDHELLESWKTISPITIELDIDEKHELPKEFILCFYWIEVGVIRVDNTNRLILNIYEKDFISILDISVVLDELKK